MKLTRTDTSRFARWWFTVDHVLLSAFLILIAAGVVLSLAASPAVAMKKGYATYFFVERHIVCAACSAVLIIVISFLSPTGGRRLALILTELDRVPMSVVLLTG